MKQQQGFSLIEALITLAILGVGLAGAAKLQSLVFSRMLESKAQNEALQFTMAQIENLRYQTGYIDASTSFPLSASHTGTHTHYELEANETTSEADTIRRLELTTRWQVPGSDSSLSVNTFLSDISYARYLHRLEH